MASQVAVTAPSSERALSYTVHTVTSLDGTCISYRQLGSGHGIVIVNGAMSSAHNSLQLAEEMVSLYTLFLPDRRGRGLSGPAGDDHDVQKEVEDLEAIITKTRSQYVFGVSSGAIIALEVALAQPALIHKLAIFEPPVYSDGAAPAAVMTRYRSEMAEGNAAAALITGMKGAQLGPPFLNFIPRSLLVWFVNMGLNAEDRKGSGDYTSMRSLAPTLEQDFQIAAMSSGRFERCEAITTKTQA